MGKVTFGLSVSLDGFIASKNDDVSEVFAWMGRAMEHFYEVIGDQLSEGGVDAVEQLGGRGRHGALLVRVSSEPKIRRESEGRKNKS